jgi:hypothetical protein
MRGSVSIEYVIVLLAFAGVYLAYVSKYVGQIGYLHDVKTMVEAKSSLWRLQAAGEFAGTSSEANVEIYLADFGEKIDTNPLQAEINVPDACGGACIVKVGYSFSNNKTIGPGLHYVIKDSGGVKVK